MNKTMTWNNSPNNYNLKEGNCVTISKNKYATMNFKQNYEDFEFELKTMEALNRVEQRGVKRISADKFLEELESW